MEQLNRNHMIIEALEFYIYKLKEDNCNQVAIDAFTTLLKEIDIDNYSTID